MPLLRLSCSLKIKLCPELPSAQLGKHAEARPPMPLKLDWALHRYKAAKPAVLYHELGQYVALS